MGRNEELGRGAAACCAILLALTVGSLVLPWLRVGLISPRCRLYEGKSLVILAIAVCALSSIAAGGAVVAAWTHRPTARRVAVLTASLLAGILGLALVLAEVAGALIPNGFLPATIRRYTLSVHAGPGLWLAFGGAILATLVLVGWLRVETWRGSTLKIDDSAENRWVPGSCRAGSRTEPAAVSHLG